MKYSIIGLIVLGLIAAFCAAFLMAFIGESRITTAADDREVTILVANRDMPTVTMVAKDDFAEKTMLVKDAPRGAYNNAVQVIGRPLTRPVKEGQPLTPECFATNQPGVTLVSALAEGKRAVTIDLPHSAGLEGLLYPGSVVDVLATFKLRKNGAGEDMAVSTTLLNSVEVLAIDDVTVGRDEAEPSDPEAQVKAKAAMRSKSRRVTLLVDSQQAEALQLASEHGTVSLAMRNPLDKAEVDRDPTLLHGGRLAGMAAYLEAFVPARDAAAPADAQTQQAAPAQAVSEAVPVAASNSQRWNITILRGSEVEMREMTRDAPHTQIAAEQ